jgi:hypothetical protein
MGWMNIRKGRKQSENCSEDLISIHFHSSTCGFWCRVEAKPTENHQFHPEISNFQINCVFALSTRTRLLFLLAFRCSSQCVSSSNSPPKADSHPAGTNHFEASPSASPDRSVRCPSDRCSRPQNSAAGCRRCALGCTW